MFLVRPLPYLAILLLYGFLVRSSGAFAQTFDQRIAQHRDTYKAEFLRSANSPLKEKDLQYLRFYKPDSTFLVEATVRLTPEAEPFELPTFDGKKRSYVSYALLSFALNGQTYQLPVYRSLELARMPQYRDYLFLPFKDQTNGAETYGGGRYMDLRRNEIRNGKLMLDFNKAYNPYCAYDDGYSCPIPPKENVLPVAIRAGEQNYTKKK